MQNVIFAGTPAFARVSLEALVAADIVPVAVLTQPDRRAGRGRQLMSSPVKQFAVEHGIPVRQPTLLNSDDVVAELAALQPDIMIVAAYGLLLPQIILDLPGAGCLNVHASLLPRWRGAAPIQAAILAGDRETGISLMKLTAGLDCGPVYARAAIPIDDHETAGELHDRLAALGAGLLTRNLAAVLAGDLPAIPQNDALASYAGKIAREDARIDWNAPAVRIARAVRAYNPAPGAFFQLDDELVKCWAAEPAGPADATAGTVLGADKHGIVVACGSDSIRLQRLQRAGKRPVSAGEMASQLNFIGRRL